MILSALAQTTLVGAIAGGTIFLGLPIARWKDTPEKVRGLLALGSAGILLFLIIEVGSRAIEIVESNLKASNANSLSACVLLVAGLFIGSVGLALLERKRNSSSNGGAEPSNIATMIAVGIGLHNFAEGLAIGQTFAGGAASFGTTLMIGFALHNATEGFGIAAPLAGQKVSWLRLLTLGLIGGGPTVLGSAVGGVYTNQLLELFSLALAVGSLIYVTRELFRLRFSSLGAASALSAIFAGLVVGIATELFVEVSMARSTSRTALGSNNKSAGEITFLPDGADPAESDIARGQSLSVVNKTNGTLEFEGTGLFMGEITIAPSQQTQVQITGAEGRYSLSDEFGRSRSATIIVTERRARDDNGAPSDELLCSVALTTMEGHVRAARDLHDRALSGSSPHAEIDIKRAGKHSGHPLHELFMASDPNARMVQLQLQKAGLFISLKSALEKYIALAGDRTVSSPSMESEYKSLLNRIESARRAVGGTKYDTAQFRQQVALLTMTVAAGEYSGAVHTGKIVVDEIGKPGKDGVLEYQDARGFLSASKNGLGHFFDTDLNDSAKKAFASLLQEFDSVEPSSLNDPIPAERVKSLVKAVGAGFRH